MEAKRCLVLMLIILGSLTVQGAMPRNRRNNPLAAFARQHVPPRECFFDFIDVEQNKRRAYSFEHGN